MPIILARAAKSLALRMYKERQAGQISVTSDDLIEKAFDETLCCICGGEPSEAWWREISGRIGYSIVTPDFLMKPAVQECAGDR